MKYLILIKRNKTEDEKEDDLLVSLNDISSFPYKAGNWIIEKNPDFETNESIYTVTRYSISGKKMYSFSFLEGYIGDGLVFSPTEEEPIRYEKWLGESHSGGKYYNKGFTEYVHGRNMYIRQTSRMKSYWEERDQINKLVSELLFLIKYNPYYSFEDLIDYIRQVAKE